MTHRNWMFSRSAGLSAVCALGLLAIGEGRAAAQPSYSKADQDRLASYTLTADHLAKAALAQAEMRKSLAADPSLASRMTPAPGEGLDQQFNRLKSIPAMVAAIRQAGLSAEDYGFTSACAIGTSMFVSFTTHKSPPGAAEAWARRTLGWQPSPDQLAFVASHAAEVHAFMQAVGMELGASR